MNRRQGLSLLAALPMGGFARSAPPLGDGDIRGNAGPSDIVITTTARLAGAIHSLHWNGMEFIDSTDHGRQMQSACSFDLAKPGDFWAECFNPTEAGSRRDGAGNTSTSRLVALAAHGDTLATKSQMAFWLNPGEKSSGKPALNTTPVSDHRHGKIVRIGHSGIPHAIEYRSIFQVPEGEHHHLGQFEALTAYMPAGFSRFLTWDPVSGKTAPLDDGPGEQALPIIFTVPEGTHAMGIFTPEKAQVPPFDKDLPQVTPHTTRPTYGRFRFPRDKVVKWNCVFRVREKQGIPTGVYSLRMFVAVGTLANVRETLVALAKKYPPG